VVDPSAGMGGLRRVTLLALFAGLISGCHPKNVRAPYDGAPPNPSALLRAEGSSITAIQVPRAKVRQRAGSATLMFSAQRPDRFVGTVQLAGNELVSVALRPDRYELRQISGRPSARGFYEGEPSPCAIAALLGVAMEPQALVSMLLGDAPVLVSASRSPGGDVQRWERAYPGHELLVLEDDNMRQELRFRWIAGAWRFAGTSVQRREGDRWERVFQIAHRDFEAFGDRQLATHIDVTSTDSNGEQQTVKIHLLDVIVDPASLVAGSTGTDANNNAHEQAAPIDRWDEDWGEEDQDRPQESGEDDPTADEAAATASESETGASVPKIFFLSPAGLRSRGDLCGDSIAGP